MINNKLFRQTVESSSYSVHELSIYSGIAEERITALMENEDDVNAVEIQSLSTVLEMPNALRRNIFFNRNLPLD